MAITKYTYSIATDTLNALVDPGALQIQVNNEATITIAVDHIESVDDVLDVYMATAISAGEETTLDGVVAAHDGTPLVVATLVEFDAKHTDAENVVKVEELPRSGDALNYYSPDLCDQTTWCENTTLVTDFEFTDSGDLTTWNTNSTHDGPWLDLTHGKMFKEDDLVAATPDFVPVVQVDTGGGWVTKTENTWTTTDEDYDIDYDDGTITFNSALVGGDKVRATFHKSPATFIWTLQPGTGKRLKLLYAEVQFTKDVVMTGSMVYETWAYNPADLPNKMMINKLTYKGFKDIIWESTGPYPVIPALGGATRGLTQDIVTLPFRYQTFRDVKASQGVELRIKLENSGPYTGEYASATFFCLQEDE